MFLIDCGMNLSARTKIIEAAKSENNGYFNFMPVLVVENFISIRKDPPKLISITYAKNLKCKFVGIPTVFR